MKENAKLFLVSIITIIISITGSAVANTMLQANSISYKTSNGEMADVNSALDRLFDINNVNQKMGKTNISNISDGTITGAINDLNTNLNQLVTVVEVGTLTNSAWQYIDVPEGITYETHELVNLSFEYGESRYNLPTAESSHFNQLVGFTKTNKVKYYYNSSDYVGSKLYATFLRKA